MKAPWFFYVSLGLAAIACGKSDSAPDKNRPPAVANGRELYGQLCAQCHGKALEGYAADHAPSLINPTFLESVTDEYLTKSITTGRPGTSMAAYSKQLGGPLDAASIERLVRFIRERGNVPAKQLAPIQAAGDLGRGAALYEAQCKTCHGDRTSRGEAVHLANAMFQAQATDPFIRHAIKAGRPGTKMLPFDKLTEQDIADVVAFVRSFAAPAEQQPPAIAQLPPPTGKEPLVIFPGGKEPDWKPRDGRFVPVDAVMKAYEEKRKFIIIDARPASDWMRAHITGAVSIPYHDTNRLAEIPKDTWVIAYCACPHHLSGEVVDALKKLGHAKAAILDEGINDWHRKGYPMTAAQGVEKPAAEPPGHHGHSH
ncbi:MAG: c-type cytochrome [Myxococcales bacterium]|nr:c-type cytochrome [Myxococcales bacterium]